MPEARTIQLNLSDLPDQPEPVTISLADLPDQPEKPVYPSPEVQRLADRLVNPEGAEPQPPSWVPPFEPNYVGSADLPRAELRAAPPAEEGILSGLKNLLFYPGGREKTVGTSTARAADAIALQEHLASVGQDLPLSFVYENLDRLSPLRDYPGNREFLDKMMTAGVAAGLMSNPIATGLGIAGYMGLAEAENYAISKTKGEQYRFGAGRGLSELLPEDASERLKTLVDLGDMAVKAVGVGAAGARKNAILTRFFRDVVASYDLPKKVYLDPKALRDNNLTEYEQSLVADLKIPPEEWATALQHGIKIEVPTEVFLSIADKPIWAKVKGWFGVSPYAETALFRLGEVKPAAPEGLPAPESAAKARPGEPAVPPGPGSQPRAGVVPLSGEKAPETALNAVPAVKLSARQIDVAQQVLTFFQNVELSREQSMGVVSNLFRESSLNPMNKLGDGGTSHYLAQWRADRLAKLMAYAASKGEQDPSVQTQLEFMWQELNGPERKALEALKAAVTEREAADALMIHYERPAVAIPGVSKLVGPTLARITGEDHAVGSASVPAPSGAREEFINAIGRNANLSVEDGRSLLAGIDAHAGAWAGPTGDRGPWFDQLLSDSSIAYRANTNELSPVNQVGYTMWSDSERVLGGHYGNVGWEIDTAGLPDVAAFAGKVAVKFEQDFKSGALPVELDSILRQPGATVRKLIADSFNPDRLEESAGLWDSPDFVSWFWENFGQPENLRGVKTKDGAIIFDRGYADKNARRISHDELTAEGNVLQYPITSNQAGRKYVQSSARARRELEAQGQINAFAGGKVQKAPGENAPEGSDSGGPGDLPPEPFTTLGKAFRDIERTGPVSIVGQKVETAADLAELAQVWRNPNYEELRYIFVKDGLVVDHEGITLRLPGQVSFFAQDVKAGLEHLQARIKSLEADGIYLVHNHPSGHPTPSAADLDATRSLSKFVPEILGHIVIDSGEYALIDIDGKATIHPLPSAKAKDWVDPILSPSVPHSTLGIIMRNSMDAAKWVKALTSERNRPIIIYLDTKLAVRGLQEIGLDLSSQHAELSAAMPDRLVEFGSNGAILILPEGAWTSLEDIARKLTGSGVFWDVVGLDRAGKPISIMSIPRSNVFGGRRVSSFKPLVIKQEQRPYGEFLREIETGTAEEVGAAVHRKIALDGDRRGNVLYELQDEYFSVPPAGEPIPPEAIGDYTQLQAEAARRALLVVEETWAKKQARIEAGWRKQAEAMLTDEPVWRAKKYIIEKGGLNKASLMRDYDRDTVVELMRRNPGLITNRGKIFPDVFAIDNGFNSYDEFVQALIDFPTKSEYIERFVDDYRKATADEREYDLAEWNALLVEKEIEIFNELLGPSTEAWANRPTPGIKRSIIEQTSSIKVGEARDSSEYHNLKAGLRMAARAARTAFAAGKREQALRDKLRQQDIAERLRIRLAARKEYRKIKKELVEAVNDKRVDWDYREQMIQILAPFNLRAKGFKPSGESLSDFVARKSREGDAILFDPSIVAALSTRKLNDLTMEELRTLRDIIAHLRHVGRAQREFLDTTRAISFEAAARAIAERIYDTAVKIRDIPHRLSERQKTVMEVLTGQYRELQRLLLKPEFLFRYMDGGEEFGPAWLNLWQAMKKAEDVETVLGGEVFAAYKEALTPYLKQLRGWRRVKIPVPKTGFLLTKEEIMGFYANTVHPDNLRHLRQGYAQDRPPLSDDEIAAVVGMLSKEEKQLVRQLIAVIDRCWKPLSETYKTLTGVPLRKVEGVYFPVKIDPKAAGGVIEEAALSKEVENSFKDFFPVSLEKGMTIARRGGGKPLRLDFFSVVQEHITDTIHYATQSVALRDTLKLLSHPYVQRAIRETLGDEAYAQLKPWLKEIARPGTRPLNKIEYWVNYVRNNYTYFVMGWRLTTALVQPTAYTNTIGELGLAGAMRGLNEYFRSPSQWHEFILSRSPFMGIRSQSFDRDLYDVQARFSPEVSQQFAAVRQTMFWLISFLDRMAAEPTWLAAYRMAMNGEVQNVEAGEEPVAIEYADGVVRRTQGSGMPKDLAGVQRGGAFQKLFLTQFYSFFNVVYNQLWEAWSAKSRGGSWGDFIRAYWWLVFVPALINSAMQERRVPKGGGDFAKLVGNSQLLYMLGTIPLIRDAANVALEGYDYRAGAIGAAMDEIKQISGAATGKKDQGRRFLVHALKIAGIATGLPPDQAIIALQGAMDLASGKAKSPARLLFREHKEKK